MNRRQATAALGSIAFAARAPAQPTSPAEVSVEDFFRRPLVTQAELNPAGTWAAMCMHGETGRRRLAVVELATMRSKVIASFDAVDVDRFQWAGDTRLVFQVNDDEHGAFPRSWYGVDATGESFKLLTMRGGELLRQGPRTGDHVLIQRVRDMTEGPGDFELSRLNVRNGQESEFDVPPWSTGFLIDARGEPVAAITARGDTKRLLWRDDKQWRVVREGDRFFGEMFSLEAMGPDGTVYVTARRDGDLSALHTYAPATHALSNKPLLALDRFDVEPVLVFGHGKLLGAHVHADAWTTVWFDEGLKALQARVDAKLPNTGNLLSVPQHGDSPWVLVWAWSDRQPAMAVLYHRQTEKLTVLARSMPWIDPARMSRMDFIAYPARDGRSVPAYLTLPASAGAKRPLPLVLLVHGGPFVRGSSWRWDAEVQFLASRGYAVLQPEFRGSTGFGESHYKAGWKQWGLAMQDDLADGVRWAVAQGIADSTRVAIAGASYGGYAAMMGLAKQAGLFACAINWVGVTDLDLMFGAYWSDLSKAYKQHGLPKVLGDRKADAQQLKDNSPIHLAERIRKPVLMAYGGRDRRVPIRHGERMRDALRPLNPDVEWVVYAEEGHGWYRLETRKDFWTRVERFLGRHLKG